MNRKGFTPIIMALITVGLIILGRVGYMMFMQSASPSVAPQQLVGNDRDAHGCIGSAGYSWCETKQKCLRPWEEKCETTPASSTDIISKAYPKEKYPELYLVPTYHEVNNASGIPMSEPYAVPGASLRAPNPDSIIDTLKRTHNIQFYYREEKSFYFNAGMLDPAMAKLFVTNLFIKARASASEEKLLGGLLYASLYEQYRAVYDEIPADESTGTPLSKIGSESLARNGIIMRAKYNEMSGLEASAFYKFLTPYARGFQKGNPSNKDDSEVYVRIFDIKNGDHYIELTFDIGNWAQQEIDAVIASVRFT